MEELKAGLSYTSETVVSDANSANAVGSGLLDVFATPSMIALMENAAANAVAPCLQAGANTVGTEICVAHSKASPIGAKITATATLTAVDGRKLSFEVVASDNDGEIGRGTHTRFVIDTEKFMNRLKK